MKTYMLRKESRTPVQCQFYCATDDMLLNGMVWDISKTSIRVTVERPVPVGLRKPIVIALQEGENCHHLLINSAMVRWADGNEAGWEFMQMDDVDHMRLTYFLEQREQANFASEAMVL
jgi:hypothetical protein